MLVSKINSRYNTLTVQIFASFWIVLFLLLTLAFSIPQFDNRAYNKLQDESLRSYQKQIVTVFRENQIFRLMNGKDQLTPAEETNEVHPILVNPKTQDILGARKNELDAARQFVTTSKNVDNPLIKSFYNIEIAGPFIVHISTSNNSTKEQPYLLYFAKPVNPQQEFISYVFDHPLVLLMAIMILSSPLLWALAWNIARPIRHLGRAANRVASGDFTVDPELERKGVYEVRQVGTSFNHMTEVISDLLETHQSLLSSISHELRTPLTRLQLAAALLRRRTGESHEITRIETETERLNKMIDDLLQLSRNQLNIHVERAMFKINELWDEVLSDAQFEAEQRKVRFDLMQKILSPENYRIYGNRQALASALENILRNALKYTKDKIAAEISLQHDTVNIIIDDNGTGIPETEYEKIFRPFYRVDEARTRTTGGTGLGLAIVENNINQHHGKVWAAKSPLGGLRIIMVIPLYTGKGNELLEH